MGSFPFNPINPVGTVTPPQPGILKYPNTNSSMEWSVSFLDTGVDLECEGDGQMYFSMTLSPSISVDIDPGPVFNDPPSTNFEHMLFKWDGSSAAGPALEWTKQIPHDFWEFGIRSFYYDIDVNESIQIAAGFTDILDINLGTAIYETATSCPVGINYCRDIFVSSLQICGNTIFSNTNLDLCYGSNYTFPDGTSYDNITVPFSHTANFTGSNGCDSIITYSAQIAVDVLTEITAYRCSGESYTLPDGSSVSPISDSQYFTTLTSSLGCDSTIQTNIFIETPPVITAEVSCNSNNITLTVTDMGTYQGSIAPPFNIRDESQTITILITGVGTYSYPISDNMLSTRIFQFEANNCAPALYIYNACDQSICEGSDSDHLLNGDFENSAANWSQFESFLDDSSTGFLPITTHTIGNRAYNYSTTSAWFGGWNQGSINSISQDVIIDAGGSATLDWWQRQQNGCAADDVLTVLIDGDTIFELQADQDPHCGNTGGTTPWNFKSVDVSAYADGQSHNVMFHYTQQGTNGYTNLFIDNINLYTCETLAVPGCMDSSACNFDADATIDDGTCLLIGDFCNDGDSNTINDTIQNNCECEGQETSISGCTDLIISEVVEGFSNNHGKAIFPIIFAVSSEYGLVRFQNGSATPGNITYLTGVSIAPYDVYVVVLDKRNPDGTGFEVPVWDELQLQADVFVNPSYNDGQEVMYFDGNDAVAILKDGGNQLVDIFGKIGEGAGFPGWGSYIDNQGDQAFVSKDHTLVRKASFTQGYTANPESFDILNEYDSLPANTFTQLGFHLCDCETLAVPGCMDSSACNFDDEASVMTDLALNLMSAEIVEE